MTLFDSMLLEGFADRRQLSAPASQSGLPLELRPDSQVSLVASPAALGIKRALDIFGSAITLVLLLPLLLVVAVAIKTTSRGPFLLTQKREGLGGRLFEMYKFRTMYADWCDRSGTVQATGNDPRVTPIGRFLRQTSIDELPQLLNVLLGQMSLVGPRPHVPDMTAAGVLYRQLVPQYEQRLTAKPGLTGWAQANGLRGPTTDRDRAIDRVLHDLAYIQNWSLALDARIIVRTLIREFTFTSGS